MRYTALAFNSSSGKISVNHLRCATLPGFVVLVSVVASVACSGCGSGASGGGGSLQAVSILTQPASQTVPLGVTATFNVVASGAGTLHYQWMEHGQPISGATAASYTTPDVTAEDNGEMFSVVVSNDNSSVTSANAVLTVGPRSPKTGDLRFQLMDTPFEADQGMDSDILGTGVPAGYLLADTNATISPLELGGDCASNVVADCIWGVFFTTLPAGQTGIDSYAYSGNYSSFASDLSTGIAQQPALNSDSSAVITSLDLEPNNQLYAMTWMQSTLSTGFSMTRQVVAPNEVSSTVATDGENGQVVTAVSFDDNTGQVNLISYAWNENAGETYDTEAEFVTPADVASASTALANDGYIITACGGNNNDGYLLIGTKVHGDTLPRPMEIETSSTRTDVSSGQVAGYSIVANVAVPGEGNSLVFTVVYEK